MHPFSAHLEPDLRLWSDFKQNFWTFFGAKNRWGQSASLLKKFFYAIFFPYKKFFQNGGKNMCHTKEFFDFYSMIWILLKIAPQP